MATTAAAEVLARKVEEREIRKSLEQEDQTLSIRLKNTKNEKNVEDEETEKKNVKIQ